MAKYLPAEICQPAYCDAMQERTGSSVITCTCGLKMPAISPGHKLTSASSAKQASKVAAWPKKVRIGAPAWMTRPGSGISAKSGICSMELRRTDVVHGPSLGNSSERLAKKIAFPTNGARASEPEAFATGGD